MGSFQITSPSLHACTIGAHACAICGICTNHIHMICMHPTAVNPQVCGTAYSPCGSYLHAIASCGSCTMVEHQTHQSVKTSYSLKPPRIRAHAVLAHGCSISCRDFLNPQSYSYQPCLCQNPSHAPTHGIRANENVVRASQQHLTCLPHA